MEILDGIERLDPSAILLFIVIVALALALIEKSITSGKVVGNLLMSPIKRLERSLDARMDECMSGIEEKFEERLSNDFRRLNRAEQDIADHERRIAENTRRIEDIEAHLTAMTIEGTITISALKTILNKMLGHAGESDVIDTVNDIDDYLIKRREEK